MIGISRPQALLKFYHGNGCPKRRQCINKQKFISTLRASWQNPRRIQDPKKLATAGMKPLATEYFAYLSFRSLFEPAIIPNLVWGECPFGPMAANAQSIINHRMKDDVVRFYVGSLPQELSSLSRWGCLPLLEGCRNGMTQEAYHKSGLAMPPLNRLLL